MSEYEREPSGWGLVVGTLVAFVLVWIFIAGTGLLVIGLHALTS